MKLCWNESLTCNTVHEKIDVLLLQQTGYNRLPWHNEATRHTLFAQAQNLCWLESFTFLGERVSPLFSIWSNIW